MKLPLLRLFCLVLLFFGFSGCKKMNLFPSCYKLEIVELSRSNHSVCGPVVCKVLSSPEPDVPKDSFVKISTGANLSVFKVGDIIYLKVIERNQIVNEDTECHYNLSFVLGGMLCE